MSRKNKNLTGMEEDFFDFIEKISLIAIIIAAAGSFQKAMKLNLCGNLSEKQRNGLIHMVPPSLGGEDTSPDVEEVWQLLINEGIRDTGFSLDYLRTRVFQVEAGQISPDEFLYT